MQLSAARVLVAEAIGTFALVFAGAGAVMVDAKTQTLGQVGIAITFGLVVMVMVYAVGHISGAPLQRRRHLRLCAHAISRGHARLPTGQRS
jgi:glycerol uptake facilitator-like aquaporin